MTTESMSPRKKSTTPKDKDCQVELFNVSRRSFIKRCAIVAAATGLPMWFVERELVAAEEKVKKPAANDRPRVGVVGCGGMSEWDTELASHWGDIVAVCDVDDARSAKFEKKFAKDGKKPTPYKDFRKVLDRSDVDVILNVTPDHWHTLVNYAASRAGKDIYSEKPLTLTIDEGRRLVKTIRENGTILQTGTQQRSMAKFRLACELVRNGMLDELKEANVWLPAGLRDGPFEEAAVPAGLDWDFWQGQTPSVPYVPQRCHANFRFWYEYSGGTMTDWGAHHNDIAYWAVGLKAPQEVSSERLSEPVPGGYNAYADYKVSYTYENGVKLNINTTKDDSIYGGVINQDGQRNGIRFVGTDGWIWVNRDGIEASDPEILKTELPDDAIRLYESKNHMGNFFECVNTRKDPICDVETGHLSANMCHLGAISLRTGHKLKWNAEKEKFVGKNAKDANTYLAREMRAPYNYSFAG